MADPSLQARIQALLQARGVALPGLSGATERSDRHALSQQQQRMWRGMQREPQHSVFHAHHTFRLRGKLHIDSLERAMASIWQRHEALRTTFHVTDTAVYQQTSNAAAPRLKITDLQAVDAAAREDQAIALAKVEAAAPFDLANGPLLRVHLLKLDHDVHWLQVVVHHLISDGWSMFLLARDVTAFYNAYRHGNSALPSEGSRMRYVDYVEWQRRTQRLTAPEGAGEFWRRYLAGSPGRVAFGSPSEGAPTASEERTAEIQLSAKLIADLRRFCRTMKTTPFVVLLTGFQILMAVLTGRRDLVVGTVLSGRDRRDLHETFGYFIQHVALRFACSPTMTVREVLSVAHQAFLDVLEHQAEQLDESLPAAEAEDHLYQLRFNYINFGRSVKLDELEIEPVRIRGMLRFDLACYVFDDGVSASVRFRYKGSLSSPPAMRRVLHGYTTTLEQMLLGADRPLRDLFSIWRSSLRTHEQ
jgi:hypothetical protein